MDCCLVLNLARISGPSELPDLADHIISIITEDAGVRSIFQDQNGFLSTDLRGNELWLKGWLKAVIVMAGSEILLRAGGGFLLRKE